MIDGDKYEEKNRERQKFTEFANKAEATKYWLKEIFPELEIETKPYFVDSKNIFLFIKEKDIVFVAVDNHATRKVVSDHVKTLDDIVLISGGNEENDGNVQVYEKKGGKERTPSITAFHPEIEKPKDKNPADLSCEELAKLPSSRQILAVNFMIAALMLNVFTLVLKKGDEELLYNEVYYDHLTGNVKAIKRN